MFISSFFVWYYICMCNVCVVVYCEVNGYNKIDYGNRV